MIDVFFWSADTSCPNLGYWSTALIEDMLNGLVWTPSNRYDLQVHEGKPGPEIRNCVLVIPGRFQTNKLFQEVQEVLNGLDSCLFIYVADEEQLSNWQNLKHDNIEFWIQAPFIKDSNKCHFIPFGYSPHTRSSIKEIGFISDPMYDWSFCGQNTHKRRYDLTHCLERMSGGYLNTTQGFAQGLNRKDYIETLCQTRVAPAPGGPVHVDSFRAYEALEAGCNVVVDMYAGNLSGPKFYDYLFEDGSKPFEVSSTWKDFDKTVNRLKSINPAYSNSIWQQYKRSETIRLHNSLSKLTGLPFDHEDDLSFLVVTSPVLSHPSTEIIEETIDSIRFWQPDGEIIIACDNVRPEQEHLRQAYDEYLRRLVWLCNHQWTNTVPVILPEWGHQANTAREGLKFINTETFCFVEHDCPFFTDNPIDWKGCVRIIKNNELDILRFHFEADVIKEHRHLLIDQDPTQIDSVPIQRTLQYSQRPFITRSDYYLQIINEYFPLTSRTMLEDRLHGAAQDDPDKFRIALYAPEGNKKRTGHQNGRLTEPKFEMKFT